MKSGAGRRGELAAGLCSLDTSNLRLLCQLASFGALGSTGSTGSVAGPCPSRSGRELALFGRGRLCVRFVITRLPQSTCPSYRSGRNWVCFARFGPNGAGGAILPVCAIPARAELASLRACPQCRRCAGPSGHWLFRLGWGQLGSFGAIGPSDASAGVFARPRPSLSVPANWLRLYHRAQRRLRRRPRPSASAPVARGELASFRTPWFGVPRLRGSDRSSLGTPISRSALESSQSRRNPPKSWSLICRLLFCCSAIIREVPTMSQIKSRLS